MEDFFFCMDYLEFVDIVVGVVFVLQVFGKVVDVFGLEKLLIELVKLCVL